MIAANKRREPLFRIAKRNTCTWKTRLIAISSVILAVFLISTLFILLIAKKNPFPAFIYLFQGTFENSIKFWASVKEAVLLLGITLALIPCYRMKFWNIGAQGQILVGALFTSFLMLQLGDKIPNYALILLSILCSMIAGAVWALIPAFFKAKFNTNETLFTLMMNYVAVFFVTFCVDRWKGDKSALGIINAKSHAGWLEFKTGNSGIDTFVSDYLNSKVLIPMLVIIALVFVIYIYVSKSKSGYEAYVIGDSLATAKYTGINIAKVMCKTLIFSGAICGLIGFFYVSAFDHTISPSTGGGYGFTAVIVCWLSNFNQFIAIAYSFMIVFLQKGARNLSNVSYAPALNEYSMEFVIFVIIISIMLTTFFIRYRIVFNQAQYRDEKRRKLLTKNLDMKEAK